MYAIKITTNELFHHGIVGQKKGVRNGPPYPLDYEDHSEEEKRLNKAEDISGDENENAHLERTKKRIIVSAAVGVGVVAAVGAAWIAGKNNEKKAEHLRRSEIAKKAAATRKVNTAKKVMKTPVSAVSNTFNTVMNIGELKILNIISHDRLRL